MINQEDFDNYGRRKETGRNREMEDRRRCELRRRERVDNAKLESDNKNKGAKTSIFNNNK